MQWKGYDIGSGQIASNALRHWQLSLTFEQAHCLPIKIMQCWRRFLFVNHVFPPNCKPQIAFNALTHMILAFVSSLLLDNNGITSFFTDFYKCTAFYWVEIPNTVNNSNREKRGDFVPFLLCNKGCTNRVLKPYEFPLNPSPQLNLHLIT